MKAKPVFRAEAKILLVFPQKVVYVSFRIHLLFSDNFGATDAKKE